MQVFCGTDIIEIERIKDNVDKHVDTFIDRVFTKNEIAYCESKKSMRYQHYAARFAAKEAIFKAISKNIDNKYDIEWKNVEIINDENGRPQVKFLDYKINNIKNIDISLSHCKEYAIAMAVVEID